ncbi:hypothetical protein TKWG_14030 [Advenella kashmirensis WT001]|uniref:Uncharacterized protein n=1 Tax=Advenella kashmirensis (strain DSM 17095 / LMG 22695 / WT001) TaxID=1036672 RepID=I3UCZ8_ADVKW|nr:hypothetical protein TKWG_14030 [Advenella kashmirensis WT001]
MSHVARRVTARLVENLSALHKARVSAVMQVIIVLLGDGVGPQAMPVDIACSPEHNDLFTNKN